MKTLLSVVVVITVVWIGCPCHARVPTSLSKNLCQAHPLGIIKRKDGLPQSIRSALTRAFQEREFSIADPTEDFQRTDFVTVETGRKPLPTRRLLFAFKTAEHFVVYYESSNMGLGANALIFSNSESRPRLVWGGVEPDYNKLAKTPGELMNRICKERLISDRRFLW